MAALSAALYLLRHRFWSSRWIVVGNGGVVFISRVKDVVSRRRGAAGYRWRMRDDGQAQDGGAVRRHGGVDGWPGKVSAMILLEMGRGRRW